MKASIPEFCIHLPAFASKVKTERHFFLNIAKLTSFWHSKFWFVLLGVLHFLFQLSPLVNRLTEYVNSCTFSTHIQIWLPTPVDVKLWGLAAYLHWICMEQKNSQTLSPLSIMSNTDLFYFIIFALLTFFLTFYFDVVLIRLLILLVHFSFGWIVQQC